MIRVLNQYVSPKSIVLFLTEAGLIVLALLVSVWIRFLGNATSVESYISPPEFTIQVAAFLATLLVCFYYSDLYSLNVIRGRNEVLIGLGQSLGSGCLLLALLYFVFPSLILGRGVFFISVALVPLFVITSRILLDRLWRAAAPAERVLILGSEALAIAVAGELLRREDLNAELVGFVQLAPVGRLGEARPGVVKTSWVAASAAGRGSAVATVASMAQDAEVLGRPLISNPANLQAFVEEAGVSRIIVAMEDLRGALPTRDLVRLRVQGIRVEDANSTIAALTGRVWLRTVKPSWFVFSDGFHRSTTTLILKRSIDLAAGVLGLILSLPMMLCVAVAVRLDSKGPVLFRQTRVGLRGKTFELLKFRSMRVDAESNGAQWASTNDPRITRIGRFLRKYRFDELPQFLNVIRGEMSFVGPRPERPCFVEELRKTIPYYDERHSVRPGLTGWAQVQYAYGSSIEDAFNKLEYDLFYLQNLSVVFDLAIVFQTIRIVVGGRGGR